jgi:16S rRNA (cytidine1402-2'-O)-methyltransferase
VVYLLNLSDIFINVNGRIYLIPVTLGGDDFLKVIPEKVISLTKQLRYFVVEDIRSARRFLRLIDKKFPINDSEFYELNEHTGESDIAYFLEPVFKGSDIGILSEAGLPGIADPGAKIIALAHMKGITVTPLSGPSSIIMALISSGLNGQNFTFNGYLPVKPAERSAKLRELEKKAGEGFAQIFMETPYRNHNMLESIVSTCHKDTMLCIAADITLPTESIRTLRISEWKRDLPLLKDRLVVFVMQ